jgi:isoquinoline 1-oxidoreductase alpha subunit
LQIRLGMPRHNRFEYTGCIALGETTMTLTINGIQTDLSGIDPDTPLLWALRDHLGLVGTKYGCGIAQCGACTVWLNGAPVRSCQLTVGTLGDASITTIEGLAVDGLHAVQRAWIEEDVAQCGYCQAGQIMAAAALLEKHPDPSDEQINVAMAGNICRCGTYVRIRKAIKSASSVLRSGVRFFDPGESELSVNPVDSGGVRS